MYAVITCAHCKQAVQVAESSLGKPVRCPLCGQATPAEVKPTLPVAEPLPEAGGPPLSLDEAEQLPPKPLPPDRSSAALPPTDKHTAPPPGKPRSPLRLGLQIAGSLLLALLAVAAVVAYFRYGSGQVPEGAWREFCPPDGRCCVQMPGEPEAADVPAEAYAGVGGRRFSVNRWF